MASKELTDMIDRLVTEKTFGLDALDSVKALKNKAERLENELDLTQKRTNKLEGDIAAQIAENARLNLEIGKIAGREAAVKAREEKIHELETASAVARAESSVWERATRIVFAPNTVREKIVRNSGGGTNGPNSEYRSHSTFTNDQEQRTEGYAAAPDAGSSSSVGTGRPEGT
jgi:regulator of replication initiation timing